MEVVEIDLLQQRLKEAEDKLEMVKDWAHKHLEDLAGLQGNIPKSNEISSLYDILGMRPKWSWMEKPGLAWGNINGENVPLNVESRRMARYKTFGEMLGHAKCNHTQRDYETIDDFFCGGSIDYGGGVEELC